MGFKVPAASQTPTIAVVNYNPPPFPTLAKIHPADQEALNKWASEHQQHLNDQLNALAASINALQSKTPNKS